MPDEKRVVWQVVATQVLIRRRLEEYLASGNFSVIRNGCCPVDVRLGSVRAAVELTDTELAVLDAMLDTDTAQEIADRLQMSRDSVYSHFRALSAAFKVNSRHQVILRAIRTGVLVVSPTGEISSRPKDLKNENHNPLRKMRRQREESR